jgi:signal transduction histidine kinase
VTDAHRIDPAGERARVVHELHDLAAHAVAQVVVHAGVLQTHPDSDRADRAASVAAIQRAADSAMRDLRRIHALLATDGTVPYTPQPDLGALRDLLDDLRRSGMAAEASLDTRVATVPPSAALAAYRLVQRLLDGVRALDGAHLARIDVAVAGGSLAIDAEVVVPPGHAATTVSRALAAPRERVRQHGGSLRISHPQPHRWCCRASLPLTG